MKALSLIGGLLAGLVLSAGPAQAQTAVNIYTGGIPAWYTWYGFPANMSYYYGPVAFVKPKALVEVGVPAGPMVEAAVPARPMVYVDTPVAQKECREAAVPDDRALVRVEVPADARVWFQDKLTRQKGTDRVFVSPPIERGHSLTYTVKATWRENGRDVTHQQKVEVRPGRETTVNFMDRAKDLLQTRVEELPRP